MSDLGSLLLYVGCFILSAGMLSFGINKKSKTLKILALSLPIALIGLRMGVGTDYGSYVTLFEEYSDTELWNELIAGRPIGMEAGFYMLVKLASIFTNKAWLIFLFSSTLTVGIAYLAIRRLSPSNVPLAFLLYLFILVPFTMNGIRQGIAMSIIFLAFSYMLKGKLLKYILAVLLASLFHSSAIVILPLYLLRNIILSKRADAPLALLISVVVAALILAFIPFSLVVLSMIPALSGYLNYVGWAAGLSTITLALKTAVALVVTVTYRHMTSISNSMKLMAALFFLEFATYFLGGLSDAFSRISLYFSVGGLIYLANIPVIFPIRQKRTVSFMVVMSGLLYFGLFYYVFGYSEIMPYQSIWSQ